MPAVQEKVKELIGKDPHSGRQPGRGRRHRRRHPGGRAARRGEGRPAARRDATVARHRDEGRRLHATDRAQHDHPDEEVGDLHDRRGQPAVRRGPRAAGRVERWPPSTRRSASSSSSASRRRPRGDAPDRGHLRHRRQRHHQRLRQGPRHRQRAADPDRGRLGSHRGRGSAHGHGRGVACGRGQAAARDRRHEEPGRGPRLRDRALAQGAPRQARSGRGLDDRRPSDGAQAGPGRLGRGRHQEPRPRRCSRPHRSWRRRSTHRPPRSSRPRRRQSGDGAASDDEVVEEADYEVIDEEEAKTS